MRPPPLPSLTRRAVMHLLAVAPFTAQPGQLFAADMSLPSTSGVRTRSGVQFIDFKVGEGATPRFGQLLRFHYVGYLAGARPGELDVWDNTYERNAPFFTKHGNGFTCQGLEEAVHTMRVGGRRRVVVPPALGYTSDKGPYPPNSAARNKLFTGISEGRQVIFDVELLSATDDLLDRGDYDDLDVDDAANVFQKISSPPPSTA